MPTPYGPTIAGDIALDSPLTPQFPRRAPQGRVWGGSYGRQIARWGGTPSNQAGQIAFTAANYPYLDNATRAVQVFATAVGSFVQQTTETADYAPSSAATVTAGLWVRNPSTRTLNFQLTFFNIAGSTQLRWNGACEPGDWRFLTFSPNQLALNTFVFGTDVVRNIRFAQNDAGAEGAWASGESLIVGNVYLDVRPRAKFLITNDDGPASLTNPISTITSMPISGRSYVEIAEYYGFKGTLFVNPIYANTSGFLTSDELRALYDRGWSVGHHSATHPNDGSNRGLTLLGPVGVALGPGGNPNYFARARNDDTAIYADIMGGLDFVRGLNVANPEKLFALPQGAWDAFVRSAVIKSGASWVRGVSATPPTNAHSLGIGSPSGGNVFGSSLTPGGWIAQLDAVQTDGGTTLAQTRTYIDECIALGAVGANYHHALTQSNSIVFDGMCSYLRDKVDAGQIDVMTGEEFAYEMGY